MAKSAVGKDLHHDEMKLLEELELYLLCHVTSNDFNQMLKDTHSEGHDDCGNTGIKTKIPFLNLRQPDALSEDPLNLLSQSTLDSFTNSCNN